MQTHVKVLAVLFIVLSALGVLVALGVMAMFAGAAGIVGATAEGEDAAVAMPIIGLTGSFLTIFLLVVSLPGLITGFGLLSLRPWARILGIVLSAINLINFSFFPIGIVMGAYGLWVLLSKDTEHLFENQLASP
jgi:hypothetical protein